MTRYMVLRPDDRGLEIGSTWLTPAAWRTGANVEAKLLQLGYAFETLGCIRVELKTHAANERSRGAMERLGATFEGIHRKHRIVPGIGVRDTAWYSVLDDEWPAVRAGLLARLGALKVVRAALVARRGASTAASREGVAAVGARVCSARRTSVVPVRTGQDDVRRSGRAGRRTSASRRRPRSTYSRTPRALRRQPPRRFPR